MRHDLSAAGSAFGLRPITLADAGFVVQLRARGGRGAFMHSIAPDVAQQEAYLARYLERPDDYYFIIYRLATGEAEGTIGLYDIDWRDRSAQWGRWIVREGSLAALESAVLLYELAFDRLGLQMVYCRTVAANTAVLSFHRSFGLVMHELLPRHFRIGDHVYDAVEQRLTRELWNDIRAGVHATTLRFAGRVARVPERE